jgi:DNA-binding IclR family transcriptional regulator
LALWSAIVPQNGIRVSRLLDRATTLISALGSRPGQPRTVHELAAEVALPPATCTRLLKRLVDLGWADQDGNRGAYRLGPRAYALTAAAPYRQHLVAAAAPLMRRMSTRWPQAGVVLVVLRPWSRQLLWECGAYNDTGSGRMRLVAEDLWSGASGRVLVANLAARDRHLWIDHVGLPAPTVWRGIATRRELLAALNDLRHDSVAEVEQQARGLYAVAVPLPDGDGGTAALGAYLPIAAPRDGLIADLLRTAAQLGERVAAAR